MAKQKSYETTWNAETRSLTRMFPDAEGNCNQNPVVIAFDELPENVREHIIKYGMTQYTSDKLASKDPSEYIAVSEKVAKDMLAGVLRSREGYGLGANLDALAEALAAVGAAGSTEEARTALARYEIQDEDDEELIKQKKARVRAIKNNGEVKAYMDKKAGKSAVDLLSAEL